MAFNTDNISTVKFLIVGEDGSPQDFWRRYDLSDVGTRGVMFFNEEKVGEWEASANNIRIGRSGSKVHRGVIIEGTLEKDVRVVDGYGIARMKRKGEKVRLEPYNLCGARSNARGGGRYMNWQGATEDAVDCRYCLKKVEEFNG